jgi:nitrite reductase (NADH) large subunit
LNVHKGVVVNDQLRTGHADVFAAGDVAEHRGVLYGNWFVAQYQGRIAGLNAVGVTTLFAGVPRSHTLKVCGLDTFSIGQFTPLDGSYGIFSDEPAGGYRSFVFRDGLLVGSNLVGDASLARAVRKAIQEKTDFSEVLARQPSAARIAETMGK